MANKCPVGYYTALESAEGNLITLEDIERFVVEKPGIDRPARSNSSRWWYEKLITNNTVIKSSTIPQGVIVTDKFHFFPQFVRSEPYWNERVVLDGDNLVISMKTDMYTLWDAIDAWTKYRQETTGTRLDNGWYRHAVRLAARYQWWTLKGEENWHPQGPTGPTGPRGGRRSPYFDGTKGNKQNTEADDEYEDREYDDGDDQEADPEPEPEPEAEPEPQPEPQLQPEPEPEPAIGVPVAELRSVQKGVVLSIKEACKGVEKVLEDLPTINNDVVREAVRKADSFIKKKLKVGEDSVEAPVIFFCSIPELANHPSEMNNTQVGDFLKKKFANMTPKQFKRGWHGVEAYFKPHFKNTEEQHFGYVPKKGWISIDHVLAQYFGMFNHPRFMALMPPEVNAHLSNSPPIARMGFGMKRHEMCLMHKWMKHVEKTARKKRVQDMLLSDLVTTYPVVGVGS
jgi:hypothetical protein